MTLVTGAQRFFEHPEARAAENATGGARGQAAKASDFSRRLEYPKLGIV
jgi:hypothetical protein